MAAHAEAGDSHLPGTVRPALQVIAGGENVVESTAALRHQLAHHPGDATDAPAARVHVRRQRQIAGPRDAVVDRLLVPAVAEGVVNHHHTGPGAGPGRNAQQRVDRSVRGIELNRGHIVI